MCVSSKTSPAWNSPARLPAGPDLSAYGVDPVFKSGTDLYNNDLDDEADTVSFYNCNTLGYDATYNVPNTDTSLTVSAEMQTVIVWFPSTVLCELASHLGMWAALLQSQCLVNLVCVPSVGEGSNLTYIHVQRYSYSHTYMYTSIHPSLYATCTGRSTF